MDDSALAATKRAAYDRLHQLASDGDASRAYHADALWYGCHPFNELEGSAAIADVWADLHRALPRLTRRDAVFVAGLSKPDNRVPDDQPGRVLIAAWGVYEGIFEEDLCGIPASGEVVHLRFCEVHQWVDGRIARSWVLLDLLDLMNQAGVWPLAPPLGREGVWGMPVAGVLPDRVDPQAGEAGFETVMAMHAALGRFDGKSLASIDHDAYWTQDFMWYGPAGIGTTRGMRGFRAHHQIPFLIGFPDRRGAGHYVRIADGDFVVTGGWPSVVGTHRGEWLGLPATGKKVDMRVMDFYRLDGGRIVENWVPIDILWILKQMGYDVFARLKHLRGDPFLDLPG